MAAFIAGLLFVLVIFVSFVVFMVWMIMGGPKRRQPPDPDMVKLGVEIAAMKRQLNGGS